MLVSLTIKLKSLINNIVFGLSLYSPKGEEYEYWRGKSKARWNYRLFFNENLDKYAVYVAKAKQIIESQQETIAEQNKLNIWQYIYYKLY